MTKQETEDQSSNESQEKKDLRQMRTSSSSAKEEKGNTSGGSSSFNYKGTIGTWRNPVIFKKYLNSIRSTKRFETEKGVHFLFLRPKCRRKKIYDRLRELDPDSVKRIVAIKRSKTARRKAEKRRKKKEEQTLAVKKAHEENKVAIASINHKEEGIVRFNFVEAEAVEDLIAMLLAAGYTKEEVCKKIPKISKRMVNNIDKARIIKMKNKIPNAIIDAADSKVLRDIVDGKIDASTSKADLIAHRRRKVDIEKAKLLMGAGKPTLPSEEREREKKLEERFGFSKKIIEVKEEKEIKTDENNATGKTD